MDLRQKYNEAFEAFDGTIRTRIEEERYPAMGYTSNLDLLCDFNAERLNELLKEHMPGAVLSQMKAAARIQTMQELLETMVYYCSHGVGGEVDVENVGLVKSNFEFKYGMGGTAMQAAMALDSVGCPSIVHLTDDSREVCDILDTPGVYTVSQDGRLVHTDEISQTHEQEPHFIIQFKKGDKIRLGDQELVIPCSNRLILTKITVNEYVPFSESYFQWIERNARKVSSNVMSSFNGLLDLDLLKERLRFAKQHADAYRKNNPEGIVFFEDAHFHSIDVKKLCLKTLCPCVDIVSMNEEELNHTLNDIYNIKVDIDDIFSCIEGARTIRSMLGVRKGVIIHTKDYSMYVGEPLKADIERGLIYGNMLATAKADNGWYGTREQVKKVLEFDFSERGMKNYQMLKESRHAHEAVLVPSKYIDMPRFTIGLGDSFVGGVQMCF